MAEVVWTERAVGQLDEIAGYIALDKPSAAEKTVRQIYTKVGFLATAARLAVDLASTGSKPPPPAVTRVGHN